MAGYGLASFKDRIMRLVPMIGLDIKKLRRNSLQGKMNSQQLKFEHGQIIGERQSAVNEKIQVKLLKISLSDKSMFQHVPLVSELTLLVDRYRPLNDKKNKQEDKRTGGYKHEWDKDLKANGRVNKFPLSGRDYTIIDLKAERYFTPFLKPMGMSNKHRKGTAIEGASSYVHLGFRLRYYIRGKQYTTGIIGKIQLLGRREKDGTGYISYLHQR